VIPVAALGICAAILAGASAVQLRSGAAALAIGAALFAAAKVGRS
jgi:hypothetical protein